MRRALSESLLGVIAQGLIRTTDSKRAAFHDILINTDACRDYIQRGALDEVEEIMERSGIDGMVTINQSINPCWLLSKQERLTGRRRWR